MNMRRISLIVLFFSSILSFSITMTPLGLGILETGWKFSYENPAEIFYIKNRMLGFTISGDFENYEFDFQYFEPSEDNKLGGLLSFGRTTFTTVEFYRLSYIIASGDRNFSWGVGVKVTTDANFDKKGVLIDFGVDGASKYFRYGLSAKDVCVYATDGSLYQIGKLSAAAGLIFTFGKNGFYFGMEGGTHIFKTAFGYFTIALDLNVIAFGGKFGYLYNSASGQGTFEFGTGGILNLDRLKIALSYSLSLEDISLPEYLQKENFKGILTLTMNVTM